MVSLVASAAARVGPSFAPISRGACEAESRHSENLVRGFSL
jgi:hypothetical protein